ncbi:hypothetical protein OH76DRAFT_1398181 [Lentinus brumalis]|uniref:Uncharacterized protein n=1 Tax=Lentinus brumalis TaxID=2498619 RepID=A0A371DQF3_9APHY|nr:hypothetical protein OH76DRAFT_1398181 [Polyporus brumalis]
MSGSHRDLQVKYGSEDVRLLVRRIGPCSDCSLTHNIVEYTSGPGATCMCVVTRVA